MSRKVTLGPKVFNLKRDRDQIAKSYPPNEREVAQFLSAKNASGKLDGMLNEQVFELISHELGHTMQQ
ncbi:MAG: hypothetical protein P8P74_02890 [Crocinitomicaceae bacterium]|nr:hypothetical protein [Crocinitomicaceae bacterium]